MKSIRSYFTSHRNALLSIGVMLCLTAFGVNTISTSAQLKSAENTGSSPLVNRTFRVVSTTAPPGTQVIVKVELDSTGDEVATSFTLNFDPTKLSGPTVTLGADVPPGTALTVNANQAASGRVGILVDSGNSFLVSGPPRHVVSFRFNVAAGAVAGQTPITFGAAPTPRSTSDGVGNALSAAYTDGFVDIQAAPPSFFSVGGRVTTPSGAGLRNAIVVLTDPQSNQRIITTSSFGFYAFDNVQAGGPYTVSVRSRLYRFQPLNITVSSDLTNVDLVGQE